jgi:DNA-nicking Smr family endonuclease
MKRAKKTTWKQAAKKTAPLEAPEKLYRPFEELAKKDKPKPGHEPGSGTQSQPKAKQGAHLGHDGAASGPKPQGHDGAASGPKPRAQAEPRSALRSSRSASGAPPSSKRGADKAAQSEADAETFAIYMAGVRALDDKATRIPRTSSRLERAAKGVLPVVDADAPARAELQALVVEGIRFETSDDGERIEGRRIEVEPREVRRLRRGQYTVDQQVDLHGMNAVDARKAIEQFIEKRRKEGDRVVRIVHGKGGHSPRGVSVLRGEIAAWLSQGPAKRHIAAFATAPPEDGGAGALLVLLMRRT